MSDHTVGLYRKYEVRRIGDTDKKHDECDYFVLDWVHDEFACVAMQAYADACKIKYPLLAKDIETRLRQAKFEASCEGAGTLKAKEDVNV